MVMLVIFCTNAINILAGVNGLEAGQTFIIACAVTFHNLWVLAGHGADSPSVRDGHLFSLYLMLPLATTTLAPAGLQLVPLTGARPSSPGLAHQQAAAQAHWSVRSAPCQRHAAFLGELVSTQCKDVDQRSAAANVVLMTRRSSLAIRSHTLPG